jgi:hypothetical protein
MAKKVEKRQYLMADAELKQFGDLTVLNVTRDLTDFTTRGVTEDTVENLETLVEIFFNTPTDDELLGPIMAATDAKNALAEQLKVAIRPIRSMAELKYKGMGKYNTFGFKDMARLSDKELVYLAAKVVRVGTTLLSELASEGLTQLMLTALTNLNTQFDTSIDTQQNLIENRDLAAQDRVEKGNTLYAEIARLCAIGQSLYIDSDPAKYNDYVIYGSSGTKPSLKGLVQDSLSHEPLVEATVDIPAAGIMKITNAEGKFEVHQLAAGGYDVNISRPEYAPQTLPVTITEGQTTEIEVNLVHD